MVMGHRVDDRMLRAIIAEVDADGSGELEFSEFVTLAAQFLVEEDAEEMQNELKEAFRLYDKEGTLIMNLCSFKSYLIGYLKWYLKPLNCETPGNGYITTATLREILHELDDKLTPDDLDGIIAEIDEDGSGTIDFDGMCFISTRPLTFCK